MLVQSLGHNQLLDKIHPNLAFHLDSNQYNIDGDKNLPHLSLLHPFPEISC